jgi:hypothetical protein
MYSAKYLSPMIPSFNIRKTVSFFQDFLDFTIQADFDDYVILIKNNLTIHILHAGTDIGEMEFYLEVDNIDTVWEKLKDNLAEIQHKSPFERDYGMREIHLLIPETKTLLFIGQLIN